MLKWFGLRLNHNAPFCAFCHFWCALGQIWPCLLTFSVSLCFSVFPGMPMGPALSSFCVPFHSCGLTQMECQRFGTLPIVRGTGGLADTISEKEGNSSPNGFVFYDKTPHSLQNTVKRAITIFNNHDIMRTYIQNSLLQKNSWETRIDEYENLYTQR